MKPLLSTAGEALRTEIDGLSRRYTYGENEQIFSEGECAEFLPIVASGRVKMIHFLQPGKEVIIGIFGPGEMFAVPPVFDGGKYPSTAVAMEETELFLLGRDHFLDLIRRSDEFAFAVIAWMCEMLREKTATIQNLATASPEHRVATVLLKLASREGSSLPVRIELRRQEIAEMAGLTTETTIRVIRRLANKDLLQIDRGKVIIDPAGPIRDLIRN